MRRRLPSPALVIASIALFVALAGAGVAASVFLVRSPKPITLVPGSVSADGNVTGAWVHGKRESVGVYTLTIRGDSFAPANRFFPHVRGMVSPTITISGKGVTTIPPQCGIVSENIASNGGAKAEVDCFMYDPAAGWQPADTAFDFQFAGPTS